MVSDKARAANVTKGVISIDIIVVLIKDDDSKAKAICIPFNRIIASVHISLANCCGRL